MRDTKEMAIYSELEKMEVGTTKRLAAIMHTAVQSMVDELNSASARYNVKHTINHSEVVRVK